MPHLRLAMKSPKDPEHGTSTAPFAGPRGIARRPPDYGIDFVDRAADGEGPLQLMPQPDWRRGVEEMAPVLSRDRFPSVSNRTGLPDHLKAGIENLSGFDLSDVNVHFNSSKPAALQALAYTQGTDIHVAPGQERHLPHEAWHVVQQTQGRVQPRFQLKGEQINDDQGLEHEAEVMGAKAVTMDRGTAHHISPAQRNDAVSLRPLHEKSAAPVQRAGGIEYETSIEVRDVETYQPQVTTGTGRVAQDLCIATCGNWEIQSDNSKLEFVTHTLSMTNLETTMNSMLDAIASAQGKISSTPEATPLYLEDLFPSATIAPHKYLVKTRNRIISGAPQGTLGIPFKKLYKFFDFLTHYQLASSKEAIENHIARSKGVLRDRTVLANRKEQVGRSIHAEKLAGTKAISESTSSKVTEISNVVNRHLPEKKHEETQKVKGLIHFIAQYALASSYEETGYKKKRFAIMARSSFHSMFNGLTWHGQQVFCKKVFGILHDLKLEDDAELFPESKKSFTLKEWVDSIVKGTERHIPTDNEFSSWKPVTSDLMTSPGVLADNSPTDKSMGAMGLDNDTESNELVVVELRSLFHFRRTEFGSFPVLAMKSMVKDLTNILNQTS